MLTKATQTQILFLHGCLSVSFLLLFLHHPPAAPPYLCALDRAKSWQQTSLLSLSLSIPPCAHKQGWRHPPLALTHTWIAVTLTHAPWGRSRPFFADTSRRFLLSLDFLLSCLSAAGAFLCTRTTDRYFILTGILCVCVLFTAGLGQKHRQTDTFSKQAVWNKGSEGRTDGDRRREGGLTTEQHL